MTLIKTKECFDEPLDNTLSMDELYKYFTSNIQNQELKIENFKITFLKGLNIETMRAEAFYHITTKKDNRGIRIEEERRFYINHIVPMIDNVNNCQSCDNNACSKIKIWTAPFNNRTNRTKLLYIGDNYNYLIILENDKKIKNQLNIVTSYLGNEPWFLDKILKEYNKYKKT